MNNWTNSVANDVKRQPRAAISPPKTPASLVLFDLQSATKSGEKKREMATEREPSRPTKKLHIFLPNKKKQQQSKSDKDLLQNFTSYMSKYFFSKK